jgi:polyisoprenoid-binding protein YceI
MGKRAKAILFTAVGVILVGGVAAFIAPKIYRDYFAAPAAVTPTLSANESTLKADPGEPLDPAAFVGDWQVGAGSYAGYRVNEVLNGTDVTVTGRTEQVTGSLTAEGQTVTQATFTVDVASIKTDNSSRDGYFRENVVRASANPTATFTLTTPLTIDRVPNSGEVTEHTLSGDLTLAGVTKPVSVTVQLRVDAPAAGTNTGTVEIAGQIPITFADFGMTAPNLGFVSVEPTGSVEFSLALDRPAAQ